MQYKYALCLQCVVHSRCLACVFIFVWAVHLVLMRFFGRGTAISDFWKLFCNLILNSYASVFRSYFRKYAMQCLLKNYFCVEHLHRQKKNYTRWEHTNNPLWVWFFPRHFLLRFYIHFAQMVWVCSLFHSLFSAFRVRVNSSSVLHFWGLLKYC